MNFKQLNSIGSGAYFPIQLTTIIGEDGKPEKVTLPDGTQVDKISWEPLRGDINLVKQNIIAIVTYQLGQKLRQENFGSRTWECIEEPNTSAQAYLIRDFLRDAISAWEPRVRAISTQMTKQSEKLYIKLNFQLNDSQSVEELNFEYNPQNSLINAY